MDQRAEEQLPRKKSTLRMAREQAEWHRFMSQMGKAEFDNTDADAVKSRDV